MSEAGISSCRPSAKKKKIMGGLTTAGALAIGSGIATATSMGSMFASSARNKKQQKWTQENMRLSSTLNKEAYDHQFTRQAAYYNPLHQRHLYEEAGLNPALMYSNGAGNSSISGSVASTPPVTPDVESVFDSSDAVAINQAVGNMTDLAYKSSLTEKADADTQLVLSQIADPTPVKEGERATPGQVAYEMLLENLNEKKYGNEIRKIDSEIARDTKGVRKEKIKFELENMRTRLVNDTNLSQSMVSWYNSQADLFGAQKIDLEATRASRISANEASANRDNAQATTAPSQIAKNEAESRLLSARAFNQEFKNSRLVTTGVEPGMTFWQAIPSLSGEFATRVSVALENLSESVRDKLKNAHISSVESFKNLFENLRENSYSLDEFLEDFAKSAETYK